LYALIARAATSMPAPGFFWYAKPSIAKRLSSDRTEVIRQAAGVLRFLANEKIVLVKTSKLYCLLENLTQSAAGPSVLLNHQPWIVSSNLMCSNDNSAHDDDHDACLC